MQVLRCVLDHPLASIVVLYAVDRHSLESPPANGEDQWVIGLQDLLVPPVLLQPQLHEPQPLLPREHRPHEDQVGGAEVCHTFTWNTCWYQESHVVAMGNMTSIKIHKLSFYTLGTVFTCVQGPTHKGTMCTRSYT